jgi:hypothetical protein
MNEDPVGAAARGLGRGRERSHPLDLVAQELQPHRPLGDPRVDVDDAAADGELAAVHD